MAPQPGPADQVDDLSAPLDAPDCPQCGAPLDVQVENVTVEDTLVIARKVSHCSKHERGARIYEAMKSVTATLALRGHHVAKALADLIAGKPMPPAVAR